MDELNNMHFTRQLFTCEEAFVRLGQNGETGCLVVVSPEETIHIFVAKGAVIHAAGQSSEGEKAVERAMQMKDATHLWIPDSAPQTQKLNLNIKSYALKHPANRDAHLVDTSRLSVNAVKPKPKPIAFYHLTPMDRPDERLPIKSTSIVGRDSSCDIILDHTQVSRRHCLLEVIPRGLYFRDLDSTNGVTVNGITGKDGFLSAGDNLSLGTYQLLVGKIEAES